MVIDGTGKIRRAGEASVGEVPRYVESIRIELSVRPGTL